MFGAGCSASVGRLLRVPSAPVDLENVVLKKDTAKKDAESGSSKKESGGWATLVRRETGMVIEELKRRETARFAGAGEDRILVER